MEDQDKVVSEPTPDSRKVRIRRVKKERQASGPDGRLLVDENKKPVMEPDPLVSLSFARGDKWDSQQFDPAKDEFEVDAVLASAAIETGYFEQAPETKTRLKNTPKE